MTENTLAKIPHLITRGKTYYFRMRVPLDLVDLYRKKEILMSLGTKDFIAAKHKVAIETARHLHEFEHKRKHSMGNPTVELTPDVVQRIADEFFHDVLAGDEAERKSHRVSESHRLGIEVLEEHARPVYAGDDPYNESRRWIAKMARNFVEGLNLKVTPESETDLVYAFAQASIRAVEAIEDRDKGKVVPTPALASTQPLSPHSIPNSALSITLSEVVKKYSFEQTNAGNWTEKTAYENQAVFNLIVAIVGDIPASDFGFMHAVSFKETLLRLPANINKSPLYRGKTVSEILEMPDVIPMSITTANKYLTRLSSLLRWACDHGYVQKNFAERLAISQKGKRDSEDRDMFEVNHLNAIFTAIAEHRVTATGSIASFHYWAPLLGYVTAGRVNEIASLRLDDFKEVDGIPYLSIQRQNDGDKTKTAAGKREVPLHPRLIELGLLSHVENLKGLGENKLFPELPLLKYKGYGAKVSRWFSGHSSKQDSFLWRDAGIREGKLVFHSFRHTMATFLERAETPEQLMKRVLGHSRKDNDVTFDRYSKGPEMKAKLAAITKALPLDPMVALPAYVEWIKGKRHETA